MHSRLKWTVVVGAAAVLVVSLAYHMAMSQLEDVISNEIEFRIARAKPSPDMHESLAQIQEEVRALREQREVEDPIRAHGTHPTVELTEQLKMFAVELAMIQDRLDSLDTFQPEAVEEVEDRPAASDPLTGGPPGTSKSEDEEHLFFEGLQNDLTIEAEDPAWAPVISEQLRSTFENYNRSGDRWANLVDVDCRTTLCRVVVETADDGEADDVTLKLMELGDEFSELSASKTADDSGRNLTTYFLGRSGENSPSTGLSSSP